MGFDIPIHTLKEHAFDLGKFLSDGGWHKRKDILMEPRMIRKVCEEWPDVYMSGPEGYKMVEFATKREVELSLAHLRSRVEHISRRADGLEVVLSKFK